MLHRADCQPSRYLFPDPPDTVTVGPRALSCIHNINEVGPIKNISSPLAVKNLNCKR